MATGGRKAASKADDDGGQADLQSPEVQIAWARIVARAAVDAEFYARLKESPAEVFGEFGVTLGPEVDLDKDFSPSLDEVLSAIERQGAQAAAASDQGLMGDANRCAAPGACGAVTGCACASNASAMCARTPCVAASGITEGGHAGMQNATPMGSNASVSGCFCGQFCSSSATTMATQATQQTQGSMAAGSAAGSTQQGLPKNCWGSAACIGSLGTFGGTAGTVGTGGTYGCAGGALGGSAGSMSSTPLGGGITSGGTMSSFGTYGGDPYGCQAGLPRNCNGTFGTAGSIGTVGGTAGSLACVGTFGSAGLGSCMGNTLGPDPIGQQGMMINWPKNCNGTFGTAGSLGTVGGTAGSAACVGTYGSAGLGGSVGTMASTPLGGGVTSGGTQSSFGTYGGDPYGADQQGLPKNCWGSAACIGSLGTFGGTAGTVGTGGTYGCAGGAQTAGSMSSTPLGGTAGGQQGRSNQCIGSISCVGTIDCIGTIGCGTPTAACW